MIFKVNVPFLCHVIFKFAWNFLNYSVTVSNENQSVSRQHSRSVDVSSSLGCNSAPFALGVKVLQGWRRGNVHQSSHCLCSLRRARVMPQRPSGRSRLGHACVVFTCIRLRFTEPWGIIAGASPHELHEPGLPRLSCAQLRT